MFEYNSISFITFPPPLASHFALTLRDCLSRNLNFRISVRCVGTETQAVTLRNSGNRDSKYQAIVKRIRIQPTFAAATAAIAA